MSIPAGTPVRVGRNYPSDGGTELEIYTCLPYRGRLGRVVKLSGPYVIVRLMGQPATLDGRLDWHFFEDELEVVNDGTTSVGSVAGPASLPSTGGTRA